MTNNRAPIKSALTTRLAQLRRVSGIGPVTLRKIEPFLEIGASLQQNR